MGLNVTGRWSAPGCIPTLERGNDQRSYSTSQLKTAHSVHPTEISRLMDRNPLQDTFLKAGIRVWVILAAQI
jgi:hypothetical protein